MIIRYRADGENGLDETKINRAGVGVLFVNGKPAGLLRYAQLDGVCLITAAQLKRLTCAGEDDARPVFQHSVILTARPPRAVSLYLCDISSPVFFIAAMQLSSGMKCEPLPRKASDAAV